MKKTTRYGLPYVKKYFMIVLGSVIYAVGFQFFMFPNNIVSGGLAGVSMLLNHFTGLPVGTMVIVMNIPLFIIAWKHFGLDFMISSLAGTIISSLMVDILAATGIVLTNDTMLAAFIGGAIKGAGLGIVYYVGATTGGVDIMAKLLRVKYAHINFGTLILCIDMVIVGLYAVVLKRYESAMYAVIAMYVVSKVVDLCVYGFDTSSLCYIISSKSDEMIKEIINGAVHRGVTILDGEGAYSRQKKQVIMCVVKRQQIGVLKRLIRTVDEDAFVIVSDTKNVFGKGFESISSTK